MPTRRVVPFLVLVLVVLLGLLGPLASLSLARAAAKAAKPGAKVITTTLEEWKRSFAALRAEPDTRAVFINVWATWCEPCKEEMPDLVRFARDARKKGVRVMLISADPRSQQAAVSTYLASLGVDFPTYLKTGDDMEFINGIDPAWDGTIPASWLFDRNGKRTHLWNGKVTFSELMKRLESLEPKVDSQPTRRNP